jgi:NAD(P)-dependent dehydrogenase (short-subunit alcohol dehydrogenase family)
MLDGQVAIITGAGRGIGLAIARRFAAAGAAGIVVNDLDAARAADAAAALTEGGGHAVPVEGDASAEAVVRRLVEVALGEYGRLDVLVCNAGWGEYSMVTDASLESWERTMAVCARGLFLGARHAIPAMLHGGGGAIVAVSSIHALVSTPGLGTYEAAKGAVNALVRALAVDYGHGGIRANAVCPGWIGTEWQLALLEQDAEERAAVAEATALGRIGTPDDVASAVLFLASREASFITGTTLIVDGGLCAQGSEVFALPSLRRLRREVAARVQALRTAPPDAPAVEPHGGLPTPDLF